MQRRSAWQGKVSDGVQGKCQSSKRLRHMVVFNHGTSPSVFNRTESTYEEKSVHNCLSRMAAIFTAFSKPWGLFL